MPDALCPLLLALCCNQPLVSKDIIKRWNSTNLQMVPGKLRFLAFDKSLLRAIIMAMAPIQK
jgi:hypothetical protein